MKTLLILAAVLFTGFSFAQTKTVVIHTSAECGQCKERLEGMLNYTKGVQFAELDIPSKNVTVKFNEKKISLEQIKAKIAALGYDADEVKAEEKAQKELPACCQPKGHAD